MNSVLIAVYVIGALITYCCMRLFCFELDPDVTAIMLSWILAAIWPAFLLFLIACAPFVLISKLLDFMLRQLMDFIDRRTE